ncbi:hypothetical protein CDAR_403301 [Caerostris darwini]|uniref:ATP synthase F0 subunit 8 n=1 Tax=Caerostris darwini TaxID=1538125 RepID=A0AAV4S8M2_9ARAC|nr:hypothetical protein CDAR_403301 [Caerostris darwini]
MKDTDKFLIDSPKAETPYDFWMDILIKMLIVFGALILLLIYQYMYLKWLEIKEKWRRDPRSEERGRVWIELERMPG